MNMNANLHVPDDPDLRRYRAIRAALGATILAGLVAGLAAIGAQSPERQHMTLNCAYDPAATGTLSDAQPEIPAICATAPARSAPPADGPRDDRAAYGVPDAATAKFPSAEPEPLPPTF